MSAEVEDSLADLLRSIDRANMADTYDEQAQAILSSDWLAARDAARDAALREKLAVAVEAGIADLWIPSPVQPGSIAHNELLHDVRSTVVRIIRGAAQ